MKACRYASVFALGAAIVQACGGDLPKADVGPVTVGPADASLPTRVDEVVGPQNLEREHVDAQFVQGQTRISAPPCSRVYIAVAEGKATSARDVLEAGDVMIIKYPDDTFVNVEGLALRVIQPFTCSLRDKPGPEISYRRARQSPELSWGPGGNMHAHLDVATDVSPDLYLGRLEGTLGVAEHKHEGSIEILAAVEASGTLTLDGKPQRIGARTIVSIPKNAPHSWKPDPGTKLVAWQLYLPPGPEQRFVLLDAEYKDAGSPKFDAGHSASVPYATRPAWCPIEEWLPFEHTCLRAGPFGAPAPRSSKPVSTAATPGSRPSWCPVEDWSPYDHKCLKPKP